jgi:autotransporter-associated beta strand protein
MWKSRWGRSNNLQSRRKHRPDRRPFLEGLEARRLLATNITQYHVDSQSTGANLTETQLTPSNVNAADFGQLYNTPVDGQVYAEPLVLTNVTIAAGPNTVGTPGTYNSVVFVATQNDSLYAINAADGTILWHRTFLDTSNPNDYLPGATAVTAIPNDDTNSDDINPEVGITGTPVIDPSTNTIYVLPNTKEIVDGNPYYVQRLHAINVSDGTDSAPAFIIGTTTNGNTNSTSIYVNGTGDGNVNGVVQFNALRENNRPALSLVNGEVYAEWASHGDNGPYHGWVVRWDVTHLSTQGMVLSGVLCTDPNGGEGGIWGGGGGLTFDPDESFGGQPDFYFETGNGDPRGGNPPLDANGFPADDDFYESLVKVEADPTTTATSQSANGWGLKIVDYFTPYNVNALDDADEDFGSGSPLVLPDSAGIPGHPHLIVAAGKEGTIYLLDRDNLGKFNVNDDDVLNSVYNPSTGISTPPVLINGSLSTPAYYHGTLYWVAGYNSNAWSYVVAPNPAPEPPTVPVATIEPTSETANGNFGYLPGSVMISADGSEDPAGGIAWIMDTGNDEIHAYSTLSLSTELWNSGPGSIAAVKFAVPTVANGQVFVGTQDSLQAFGLTGANTPAQAPSAPANARAQALSGSAVELTWTDSTVSPNFATSYAIQESTDGVNFTTVAHAGQESTSFTVTGLEQNTTYDFRIVGSNSTGSSGPSNIASATTTNQTGQIPTAPQGLGATPASGSEVYLTWTNTATNETGFVVTRATDSLFTQNVITESLASAPYYFTDVAPGLSPGNTYYYKLQATNTAGLSSTSNTASVRIPNVPAAPTDATAVQSGSQVVVSWTDEAGPFALGYQISRSVDGGPFTIYTDRPETSDSPPSTQTFTDTNVPLGHTYTYEIVAENVAGFSSPAYTSVSVLGAATLTLDNAGNLGFAANSGVPDRLSVQLAGGIYTLTDLAVIITVTGGGAGFVTGAGTSTVTIPAAHVSAMTLDTSDNTDTIDIISDAVPINITADSGSGKPIINLGDPAKDEVISGAITNASNGILSISGSGTTTLTGNLVCKGSGGVTLAGTGTIDIAGNINLGTTANLTDSSSGQDKISGVITGTAASGIAVYQGLIGTYFNLTAAADQIQPADPSNPDWLGNQSPAVTAQLVGPIDFPDISDNGFADSMGDPAYYDLGPGINDDVEARWYGNILIPGTGTTPVPVNFATTSDDGSMLYIDGNAVVVNNNFQGATQATGLVDLTPGLHTIDVEYYQGTGGATMDALWDPSGGTNFVDIPTSALSATLPVNGLFKLGTGTLTLTSTNSYLGSTTVSAGTLIVTANGAMGPATATGIVVNPGGALALAGGVDYAFAEPITISGSGPAGNGAIENISGANAIAFPITLAGQATIGSDAGTLTLGGDIFAASNALTVRGAGTTTINGDINSQGATVTLADSGSVNIAGNINLGATGNLTDSGSGQDKITGVISGTANSGFVAGLTGAYFNLPAAQDLIQPANPSNPAWLGNQTPALSAQLIGPIDFPDIANNGFADSVADPAYYDLGPGINDNVEARWNGDILIPGTGTTPVPVNFATTSDDGSMLYIDGNAVVVNNNFQGATQATGLVDLTPGLHTIDVEYFQGTGDATLDVQWDPTGGTNFVDIPFSAFGVPVNSLTKTGTGMLSLSNTDTYKGVTTVNSGGTLGGTGMAGAIAAKSGGVVEPGIAGATGILKSANATFSSGSTFAVLLDGTTAGTGYDELNITGTASLGNSTLDLALGSNFAASATIGAEYVILSTTQGVSGAFAGLASGDTFDVDGAEFTISYTDGDNKNVALTFDGPYITTSVALITGTSPAVYSTALTFQATVSSAGSPTGSVEFYDGATPLGPGSALAVSGDSATSTFTISTLSAGVHAIKAVYTTAGPTFGNLSGSVSQTINPLAVDLTASRIYDGTNSATSSILSVSNEVGGDDLTLSGSATLAGRDVGSQSIKSFAGLILGGTSAGDYTLTGATGSVAITPATLTTSITKDPTKSYDGTTTATLASNNFSVSGLVGGDSFTVNQTAGTYNSPNVASATTVTASLTAGDFTPGSGTLASDYTLPTSASGPGAITAATATIIVTPYTVTYDTNAHTATGTATGVAGAKLSNDLNLSGTTHTNAGTYNGDTWSFTDPTGNYKSASGIVRDVINQPPTVILGEQSVFSRKTNKKGKPVGKPVLTGYEFELSSPLNPASATNSANYQVDNVTSKRVKKKVVSILQPITKFSVSYSNDAVTIVFAQRQTFKTGGQITILNSLAGPSGPVFAGSKVFTISKGGKVITPS